MLTLFSTRSIKDPTTLDRLLRELSHQNREVREAVAVAIGAINDGSATPNLRDLLNHPFQGVRESANAALGL